MHYVNNKSLYEEILKFSSTNEITEELFLMFYEMCNRIIRKARFNEYTTERKEDMIHTAFIKCVDVLHKFDTNRTNPFSYFQSVIENCFIDCTKDNKKQEKIIEALRIKMEVADDDFGG